MAENREEILDELIKYYDDEEPSEDTAAKRADRVQEEELGNTRIIGNVAPEIVKDTEEPVSGDTVVVNVKRAVDEMVEEPEPDDNVYEEVLGTLGIDGRPIPQNIETPKETFRKEAERKKVTVERARQDEYEDDTDDGDGVWYSLKPLWITLICCVVIFLGIGIYATDTGVIGTYKRNFEYNMSIILDLFGIELDSSGDEMPVVGENGEMMVADNSSMGNAVGLSRDDSDLVNVKYNAGEKGSVIIPFEEADSSGFFPYDNGVVCVKSNYICLIDKDGQIEWEDETSVINPMIKVAGDYIAVASDGGTRLELYKEKELCYGIDAPDAIRVFDVSERGDVVLSTEKKAYKGAVTVFNKKGEQIFSWGSGVNHITDVEMLKTRQAAVALVNSDTEIVSYVMMFDVRFPDPVSGVKLENTLIFDVTSEGGDVLISGDNTMASMTDYSEIKYDTRFDEAVLSHSAQDKYRNRVLTFSVENEPVIGVYNKDGEAEYESVTEIVPDCVQIYKDTVVYSSGRDVVCDRYKKGERISYIAPTEVKKLILISESRSLLVYEDNLEIIEWY